MISVIKSNDRYHADHGWLDSRWHFSFGDYYDPSNMNWSALRVFNDDVVKGGGGFDLHPHRDMEIVTWVLSGELEHKDTLGNSGLIYPGLAQRMSAGRGIWHSEKNNTRDADVHFIQMWVLPDTEAIDPGYQQLDINPELDKGGLVPIASGRGHAAAIAIRQKYAVLWGGRLMPGESVRVPDAAFAHLYVARGAAELEGAGRLEAGDAVRLTAAGAPGLTADPADGAEVLIWEMQAGLRAA